MSLVRLDEIDESTPPSAVCLGTFDGVHLGHRKLISAAVRAAAAKDLLPAAFTFEMPPAFCFRPDACETVLTPIREKARLMEACGIRRVFYPGDAREVLKMSCEAFFRGILLEKLHARHIVIGFHYTFGKGASGNADTMRAFCAEAGVGLDVISPVYSGEGILSSSTAIRQALRRGDRSAAESMLGSELTEREIHLLGGTEN